MRYINLCGDIRLGIDNGVLHLQTTLSLPMTSCLEHVCVCVNDTSSPQYNEIQCPRTCRYSQLCQFFYLQPIEQEKTHGIEKLIMIQSHSAMKRKFWLMLNVNIKLKS